MIDFELKELLRKAYKAGRRNALKQDEANFNDFINKHESKLKLFAIPDVSNSVNCETCKYLGKEHDIYCDNCNKDNSLYEAINDC
jgi:hypothetical protein